MCPSCAERKGLLNRSVVVETTRDGAVDQAAALDVWSTRSVDDDAHRRPRNSGSGVTAPRR